MLLLLLYINTELMQCEINRDFIITMALELYPYKYLFKPVYIVCVMGLYHQWGRLVYIVCVMGLYHQWED